MRWGAGQYSINKSKALLGFVGQQWEQHIVAELDSALNKWIDSVPDHRESRPFPFPVPVSVTVALIRPFPATPDPVGLLPYPVRWDPTRENLLFLNQSANLHANYYQLQIAVHRPFIPSPRKPSPLSFPSLAICTNAARSCIHVLDVQYNRAGQPLFSNQVRHGWGCELESRVGSAVLTDLTCCCFFADTKRMRVWDLGRWGCLLRASCCC